MSRPRVIVVAGLIARGETVLLAQRLPGKHLTGYWEFPGGKLEAGEDPRSALERELTEELGVPARAGLLLDAFAHAYPEFDLLLLLYHAELAAKPRPVEVADLAWVPLPEVRRYPLPPADEPIVTRLADYLRRIRAEA